MKSDEVSALLGKEVVVTLDNDGPVVRRGTLLGYGDGGDVELLDGIGLVYHCWSRLAIREAGEADDRNLLSAGRPASMIPYDLAPVIDAAWARERARS